MKHVNTAVKASKSVPIGTRVTEGTGIALAKLADQYGLSLSATVEQILVNYLEYIELKKGE
jgi:hypothetical protein